MNSVRAIVCSLCIFAGAILVPTRAAATPTASAAPMAVTLQGIIQPANDDTLAFTPNGNAVFFDRSSGSRKAIMVSRKMNGQWSKPAVASFSGRWFDQDPLVAPNGKYMLFDSDRPVTQRSKPLVQNYFNNGNPAPGSNIWKVERTAVGWGSPVWLGPVVNSDVFVDFASVATDNTLYFIRWDKQARVMHLWRSQYRDGKYLTPVRARVGDPAISTHDPTVAPDQSFIVFDYGKVKGGLGRLCIAFREGNHWGAPVDLGDIVNRDLPRGSHLAPDGHTVFFTGQSGVWRLALHPWLQRYKRETNTGL